MTGVQTCALPISGSRSLARQGSIGIPMGKEGVDDGSGSVGGGRKSSGNEKNYMSRSAQLPPLLNPDNMKNQNQNKDKLDSDNKNWKIGHVSSWYSPATISEIGRKNKLFSLNREKDDEKSIIKNANYNPSTGINEGLRSLVYCKISQA